MTNWLQKLKSIFSTTAIERLDELPTDQEVVDAIMSVPPHYAYLFDGFSTTISMANFSGLLFIVRDIQPFSMDTGGPIDTTSMSNIGVRTAWVKHLLTLGEITLNVEWNPVLLPTIRANLGVPQTFVVTLPEGTLIDFFGAMDKFTPSVHKEGELPTAEVKIFPLNQNLLGAMVFPGVNVAIGGNLQGRVTIQGASTGVGGGN